jgi:D-serine deaminase-like pyridoxal phosphate-dependent protein
LPSHIEHIGIKKNEIDTPVLLVDFEALEYNIEKMAEHFRKTKKKSQTSQ